MNLLLRFQSAWSKRLSIELRAGLPVPDREPIRPSMLIISARAPCAVLATVSVQLGGRGRNERFGEDDVLVNLADLPGDTGIDG